VNHAAAAAGGAERSLADLLGAFPKLQVVASAALPAGGNLGQVLEGLGVPSRAMPILPLRRSFNLFYQARFVASLGRVSKELLSWGSTRQCQIVHANSTAAAVYAAWAFKNTDFPVVWHCRDLVELGWLGGWLGKHVHTVVAISETVRRHLAGSVPFDKLRLIRNGIDRQRQGRGRGRANTRLAWGIKRDDIPVVGMAAHLARWKQHDLFLYMAAHVLRELPEARFKIAGDDLAGSDPGYRRELEELAGQLGVADRVEFLGLCHDMPSFYEAIDLLCHPTDNEPFGRCVAEAMMLGRPVVVCRESGPGEYVRDGLEGLLVDAGDLEALGAAVLRILKNPTFAAGLGTTARIKAREALDVQRTAAEVLALYREILG